MSVAIYSLIIFATVLIDFITKQIVVANMQIGDSIPLIEGVLHITYITNDGAAFGSLSDFRAFFMIMSTIAIIGMGAYLFISHKSFSLPLGIAFSMIIGGGIGNMIDRIFNGEVLGHGVVIDFIDFCAFPNLWMWIFNGADAFVCVGAALFIVFYIREEVLISKKNKSVKECLEDQTSDDTHTDN